MLYCYIWDAWMLLESDGHRGNNEQLERDHKADA
jgi:hypothetical protein